MDKEEKNSKLLIILFGIIIWLFLMIVAGNFTFYENEGTFLKSLSAAFEDISGLRFHMGFTSDYLANYGKFTAIYAIAVFAFYVNEQKYKHDKGGIESGSAHFNKDIKNYNKIYTDPFGSVRSDGPTNMILSEHVRLSLMDFVTKRNCNILIVGGAGTGKTRYFIKPNVLQMNCSYIITDPSGELLRSLGNVLFESGYDVRVFNLVNMDRSCGYNPFEYMRDDSGVGILVDCFMQNTNPPDQKSSGDPFWDKSEKALLTACIYYLRDFCAKEDQTFANILMMIQSGNMEENSREKQVSPMDKLFDGQAVIKNGEIIDIYNEKTTIDKHTHQAAITKEYLNGYNEEMVNELKENLNRIKPLAWKNYQTFRLGAAKTLKSILISAAVRLNPFNIPAVANLTRKDTLHLESTGDQKTIVFTIIPQATSTFNFLASMMYSQMFEALYYKAEHTMEDKDAGTHAGRLKYHVRFLMDEFANVGKIPQFPEKISTMRKYNISCSVVLQSLAQIKKMYADDYETIIGNCDSTILLGTQEQTTAEYYSKQLGKETIKVRNTGLSRGAKSGGSMSFNQTGRELMTMDEIRTMSNEQCIVFVRGVYPFKDEKYDLSKHEKYKFTGDYDSSRNFDLMSSDLFVNVDTGVLPDDKKKDDMKEYESAMEGIVSSPKKPEDIIEETDPEKVYNGIVSDLAYSGQYSERVMNRLKEERDKNPDGIFAAYIKNIDFSSIGAFTTWVYEYLLNKKLPALLVTDFLSDDTSIACFIDKRKETQDTNYGFIQETILKFGYKPGDFEDRQNVKIVHIGQNHSEKIVERLLNDKSPVFMEETANGYMQKKDEREEVDNPLSKEPEKEDTKKAFSFRKESMQSETRGSVPDHDESRLHLNKNKKVRL